MGHQLCHKGCCDKAEHLESQLAAVQEEIKKLKAQTDIDHNVYGELFDKHITQTRILASERDAFGKRETELMMKNRKLRDLLLRGVAIIDTYNSPNFAVYKDGKYPLYVIGSNEFSKEAKLELEENE